MKRILQQISSFYWRFFASPEKYARHIGVVIGKNCLIDTRYWSSEPYLISIGNNVQVTRGVSIHTHGGGNPIRRFHKNFDVFGRVTIKDWAYIGSFSQIMPGVTIGEGAIVAAGSIVTKSVAPNTVVGGNPARFICTVEDYYEKNKFFDVQTKGKSRSEKQKILLSLDEESFIRK